MKINYSVEFAIAIFQYIYSIIGEREHEIFLNGNDRISVKYINDDGDYSVLVIDEEGVVKNIT